MMCQNGQYCNTLTNKCEQVLENGAECTMKDSCGFGKQCIWDPSLSPLTPMHCIWWRSFKAGWELQTLNPIMCETGYVWTEIDAHDDSKRYFCEKPPKLKKETDDQCTFDFFKTENGKQTSYEVVQPKYCGFNWDDKARCNNYLELSNDHLSELKEVLSQDLKCHTLSKGVGNCVRLD